VLGAVFQDGGFQAVYQVYKHLLAPFVLFVARYSKEVHGEPKEQFIIKCGREFKLRPAFRCSSDAEKMLVKGSKGQETEALMYSCKILFRNGQTMVEAVGNTKRQAERNAGVAGLQYLKEHPELRVNSL
jgi:dsRNA-specific ribonuclease